MLGNGPRFGGVLCVGVQSSAHRVPLLLVRRPSEPHGLFATGEHQLEGESFSATSLHRCFLFLLVISGVMWVSSSISRA